MDGVLYLRIVDPVMLKSSSLIFYLSIFFFFVNKLLISPNPSIHYQFKCSYGSKDPVNYTCILAQSCMRSEIGKLTLDQTFEERDKINEKILTSLKQSTEEWGLHCLRYEIKDIRVSDTIKQVMNLEADSERKKRAEILMSEGRKTSEINLAEAQKRATILKAEGKAKQILLNAEAVAERIRLISEAIN